MQESPYFCCCYKQRKYFNSDNIYTCFALLLSHDVVRLLQNDYLKESCFHLQVRTLTPGLQRVRPTKPLGKSILAVAFFFFFFWRNGSSYIYRGGPGASAACLKTVFVPRSEVSSSSSLDSPVQSAQQVSVQALLHSQCLQTSDQDQQDCEILSSQQDLFEADKTGKCTQTQ